MKNSQQGLSLIIVLVLMILATVITTAVYKSTLQTDKQSFAERRIQQADLSVKAGVVATQAYMRDRSFDFVGALNQFYEENILDQTKAKIKPIRLPLELLEDTTHNSMHERFDVYLTGLNIAPAATGADVQAKIQVMGRHKNHNEIKTESVKNIIFDIQGITFSETSYNTVGFTEVCGPSMAFWMGNGISSGQFTQGINITNGGMYVGKKYSLNHGSNWILAGDLIIGGQASSATPGAIYGKVDCSGDLYMSQPFNFTGNMANKIKGNVYLESGFAPGGITSNLTIGGDLFIKGGNKANFKINNPYKFTINGNFESAYQPHKNSGGAIDVKQDATINGNYFMTSNTINKFEVGKNARIMGDFKTNGFFKVGDSLQIDGNYNGGLNSVGGLFFADNHSTSGPISDGYSDPDNSRILVTRANELTELRSKLTAKNEVAIGFGVDAATVDDNKIGWKQLVDDAIRTIPNFKNICPTNYKTQWNHKCRLFSSQAANAMWDNKTFWNRHAQNDFVYVNLNIMGEGKPKTSDKGSSTYPLRGNWVLTQTAGETEFKAGGHNNNRGFPGTHPSARILLWMRGSSVANTFMVGGNKKFHGIFLFEGGNYKGEQDVKGTHIIGAFYLNGSGSNRLAGNGAGYKITHDQNIINGLYDSGLQRQDENGNDLGACSEPSGSKTVILNKRLKLVTNTLKVAPRAFYQADDMVAETGSESEDYEPPSKKIMPYLELSRYVLQTNAGQYENYEEILNAQEVDPIASYEGSLHYGPDVDDVCQGGSWSGDGNYNRSAIGTFEYTYTLNCHGKSIARTLLIVQGEDTGSGYSDGQNSSISDGSSDSQSSAVSSSSEANDYNIAIVSPNGGETLIKGVEQVITWNADFTADASIDLINSAGQLENIATSVDLSLGEYRYTPSVNIASGNDYTFRISEPIHNVQDVSDANFSIKLESEINYSINVVNKNGGNCSQLHYEKRTNGVWGNSHAAILGVSFGQFALEDTVRIWTNSCGETKWDTPYGLRVHQAYIHIVGNSYSDNEIDAYFNTSHLKCSEINGSYFDGYLSSLEYLKGMYTVFDSQVWEAKVDTQSEPEEGASWTSVLDCNVRLPDCYNNWKASETYSGSPGTFKVHYLGYNYVNKTWWSRNHKPNKIASKWVNQGACDVGEQPPISTPSCYNSGWSSSETYSGSPGTFKVRYGNRNYVNKEWWSRNNKPNQSSNKWVDEGVCQ